MVKRITKSEANERRENHIHWLTEMLDPNVRWVRCKGGDRLVEGRVKREALDWRIGRWFT